MSRSLFPPLTYSKYIINNLMPDEMNLMLDEKNLMPDGIIK
ncbi:MAG: hypothetical protein PVH88_06615 [Ignavibacteria bacterium]